MYFTIMMLHLSSIILGKETESYIICEFWHYLRCNKLGMT
jgi:hypothetical protein